MTVDSGNETRMSSPSTPKSGARWKRRISLTAGWLLGPILVLLPFAVGGSGPFPHRLKVGVVIALIGLSIEVAIALWHRFR
jgi:hypothetical protein